MGEKAQKKSIGYLINSLICLALLFGFGYLEPWGSLEPVGMKVLGIFLGMLYGWTFIGFIWPSLLGVIALGFSGYATVSEVISSGMGNITVTVFVLFLFIMAGYMDKVGLTTWIANWFISRKIAINRPWVLSFLIFLCVYILGAAVSVFAAIFLLWSIFYKMCDITGYKPFEKYTVFMLVGIVFSATLGFAVFPFKAVQITALGALATASNGELVINEGAFTVLNIIMSLVILVIYLLVGKYILRPDISQLKGRGDMFEHLRGQKMNVEQKVAFAFLIYFFFAMFAPSIFSTESGIGWFFNSLGQAGSLLLGLGVLALIRIDGKCPIDFADASRSIQWDIIIMFIATMPISSAMSSSDVGVVAYIVEVISPFFGEMSPIVFSVAFIVIMGVLTQFTHNLVLAAMVPGILYGFCLQFGMEAGTIGLLMTLFTFAISIAIATPGGSTMSALIFANTQWIHMKSAYLYTTVAAMISIIVILVIGFPVGQLLF
ncbi:MAG: SLC13 family permease [Peptococcaceae bacterium]|nr:SLC13 family permease [Peptococcaceae bacterium]